MFQLFKSAFSLLRSAVCLCFIHFCRCHFSIQLIQIKYGIVSKWFHLVYEIAYTINSAKKKCSTKQKSSRTRRQSHQARRATNETINVGTRWKCVRKTMYFLVMCVYMPWIYLHNMPFYLASALVFIITWIGVTDVEPLLLLLLCLYEKAYTMPKNILELLCDSFISHILAVHL